MGACQRKFLWGNCEEFLLWFWFSWPSLSLAGPCRAAAPLWGPGNFLVFVYQTPIFSNMLPLFFTDGVKVVFRVCVCVMSRYVSTSPHQPNKKCNTSAHCSIQVILCCWNFWLCQTGCKWCLRRGFLTDISCSTSILCGEVAFKARCVCCV